MKIIIVFIILSIFFLFQSRYISINSPEPIPIFIPIPSPTPKTELDEGKLWSLIQNWRQSQGLKPYIKNQTTCSYAQRRIIEIKENFSHKGFWNLPLCENCALSENLADIATEEEALKKWLKSASHSANLKQNLLYSCLETDGWYAVQIFSNF